MKQLLISLLIVASAGFFVALLQPARSVQAEDKGNLISNSIFINKSTMDENQIQNFIKSFPQSCLLPQNQPSGLSPVTFKEPLSYFTYGNDVSPARIIWKASQLYSLNPQVLLTTLEKEQNLVSGAAGCAVWKYNSSMGYNCPDGSENALKDYPNIGVSRTCVAQESNATFSRQINHAAWQLRFDKERADGNLDWGGDGNVWYYGRMTQGNRARQAGQPVAYYDGYTTIDGVSIYLANGATASLYNYTPHFNSFYTIFTRWFGSTEKEETIISFKTQLSQKGWTGSSTNSGVSGTTGEGRPIEAFRIDGSVEYSSYNPQSGWQPIVSDGMVSGTEGQSKPIQAIKINPVGSLANSYDIYYRTHISNIGWLGWTKNGAVSGVIGGNSAIEAMEIYLAPKNASAPGSTSDAYRTISTTTQPSSVSVTTQSHVSNYGWQVAVPDGMISGMTNRGRGVEAIRIKAAGLTGDISYSAHVAGIGWQSYVKNDELSGTVGRSKSIEAIRIATSGDLYKQYDLWYRAYVEGLGWLDWTNNNSPAGSIGASKKLEGLEIRLVQKGMNGPGNKTGGLYNPQRLAIPKSHTLLYSAHVSNIGWMSSVKQGEIAGTVGQTKSLESFRIDAASTVFGNIGIKCSYVSKGIGWSNSANNICGTVGESRPLRAVRLSLPDEFKSKYTISYRVHLGWMGWQNWQQDSTVVGFPDDPSTKHPIEAIMIQLTEK